MNDVALAARPAPLPNPLPGVAVRGRPRVILPTHAISTASRAGDKLAALTTCALGFLGFMPYPAINVGNTSAVQIGNILTVLMLVPFAGVLRWRRPLHVFPLLVIPVCASTLWVAATGNSADLSLSLKFTAAWGVACLTVWAAQLYIPRYSLELLSGIAAAMIVHFVIGMWQFRSFQSDSFPLVELYVNQSFLSVQDNVNTIARYIKRPFGLFPEPSAMSSSLAPWVLLFAAHFFGLVHLKRKPTRRQELLFATAACGALLLIILSRSGHAAVTLAALLGLGLIWAIRIKAKPQTHLLAIAAAAIVLPIVLILAGNMIGDRLGGSSRLGNSSWEDRTNSLLIGFRLLTDGGVGTALFGVGPGHSSPALQELAGLEAVWSVLLGFVYETGLLGIVAVTWIGSTLLRSWRAARCSAAFAAITFVWLVGITLTTSYSQLLPIWIALGWLTVWPSVCSATGFQPVCSSSSEKNHGQDARATNGGIA